MFPEVFYKSLKMLNFYEIDFMCIQPLAPTPNPPFGHIQVIRSLGNTQREINLGLLRV